MRDVFEKRRRVMDFDAFQGVEIFFEGGALQQSHHDASIVLLKLTQILETDQIGVSLLFKGLIGRSNPIVDELLQEKVHLLFALVEFRLIYLLIQLGLITALNALNFA